MSGKVLAIGCLHIEHENIAKMRGFNSAEHMWNLLKLNWNKNVNKRDTVYILGDVAMETSKYYHLLDELNGFKRVVLGNHDIPKRAHLDELLKYIKSVHGMVKYKNMWLTHCPIHESELRGKINVHAHIHDAVIEDDRYVNVDAHKVNYTPIELKNINI